MEETVVSRLQVVSGINLELENASVLKNSDYTILLTEWQYVWGGCIVNYSQDRSRTVVRTS